MDKEELVLTVARDIFVAAVAAGAIRPVSVKQEETTLTTGAVQLGDHFKVIVSKVREAAAFVPPASRK